MAYQSLYRRYRPRKFSEIKGQDHVVRALRTAVREGKVGHAYLLHGPRGTGKTTTARVLAKALNCEDLGADGEPCCACESCLSIEQNRSFDLHELDAASNNKVDDMRTLLERVNLTTPGRAKVYLLDEVHMLTSGAENALLKTLEEPPGHVTWVLATTEPHKVVQTIRSRCQVFELGLVGADIMAEHVRFVAGDAELDVDDEAVDHVLSAGGGSVRDTLTALDRVVAGGGTTELDSSSDAILGALADHDRARALAAVGDAVGRGRDPRTIGETVLAGLRDAFLVAMGDPPPRLSEHERARAGDLAERMAPAAMTRALETLGRALIDMRQAPDPRVDIEVALVRLCDPDADRSLDALIQRVQRLEERLGASPGPASMVPPPVPPVPPPPPASAASGPAIPPETDVASAAAPSRRAGPAQSARQRLGPRRTPAQPRPGPSHSSPLAPPDQGAPPPPVPARDPATLRPRTAKEVVELAGRHLGISRETVVARANELLPPRQGRRDPAELLALWSDLVARWAAEQPEPEPPRSPAPGAEQESPVPPEPASHAGPPPTSAPPGEAPAASSPPPGEAPAASSPPPGEAPAASSPPPAVADAAEADIADFDLSDLDDLTDAPSHAADIEAKIKQVFPGSEVELLPDAGSGDGA